MSEIKTQHILELSKRMDPSTLAQLANSCRDLGQSSTQPNGVSSAEVAEPKRESTTESSEFLEEFLTDDIMMTEGKIYSVRLRSSENMVLTYTNYSQPSDLDIERVLLDSGATICVCRKINMLEKIEDLVKPLKLTYAGGMTGVVTRRGVVKIHVNGGSKRFVLTLKNVLYGPDFAENIISTHVLTEAGFRLTLDKVGACLYKGNTLVGKAFKEDKSLYLDCTIVTYDKGKVPQVNTEKDSVDLWHLRLGHLGSRDLVSMSTKRVVDGLRIRDTDLHFCRGCIMGKMRRLPHPLSVTRATEKLELIHADLCGPMQTPTMSGEKYFMVLVDDRTRMMWIGLLKLKSNSQEVLKKFIRVQQAIVGKKVKFLRTDNGGGFLSKEFNSFCEENGTQRQLTVPHTSQQNGVAERAIRTITEMASAMLQHAGLDQQFWGYAVKTAAYVRNRCTGAANPKTTPWETWTGSKPDISRFRVFGCLAYANIRKEDRDRFGPRAKEGILVGYSTPRKAYVIFDIRRKVTFEAYDVTFNEKGFMNSLKEKGSGQGNLEEGYMRSRGIDENDEESWLEDSDSEEPSRRHRFQPGNAIGNLGLPPRVEDRETGTEQGIQGEQEQDSSLPDTSFQEAPTAEVENSESPEPTPEPTVSGQSGVSAETAPRRERSQGQSQVEPRRSGRTRKPVDLAAKNLEHTHSSEARRNPRDSVRAFNVASVEGEPRTLKEALQSSDKDKWQDAIQKELESLQKKRDLHSSRSNTQDKRLVAKGFTQTYGIDYDETFAPVIRYESVRFLIGLARIEGMLLHQMDVETAFLNGELKETIYMEQPEGYAEKGKEHMVCKLKKSLYGLKQAPRCWNENIDRCLHEQNFNQASLSDPYIYMRGTGKDKIIVGLYVDDMIIACQDLKTIKEFKGKLKDAYKVKDLGELKFFLGLEVNWEGEITTISQPVYIDSNLERFKMNQAKEVACPMNAAFKLTEPKEVSGEEKEEMARVPYRAVIGSLQHLARCSRPDISIAVSVLARYSNNPRRIHWEAAKWLMRYLKGTRDYKLVYRSPIDKDLG